MSNGTGGVTSAVQALMAATAELSKAVSTGVGSKVSDHLTSAIELAAESVESAARSLQTAGPEISTREQLLDAGAKVFAEKGFAAASLDEIAKRAGRTKGAIYAHFSSKDDLMMAIIEESCTDENGVAAAVVDAYVSGNLTEHMDQSVDNPDLARSALMSMEALAYAIRNPKMRERIVATLLRQKDQITQSITQRLPDAPPETALAFVSIVNLGGLYAALDSRLADGSSLAQTLERVLSAASGPLEDEKEGNDAPVTK